MMDSPPPPPILQRGYFLKIHVITKGENMIECIIYGHICRTKKKLVPMWLCSQIEWN
jgi:hypothetical protein